MLKKIEILIVLIVSAVVVKSQDPWANFCEENNVPDGIWFTHPWGDCQWFISCWGGGQTNIGQCTPEGTWFIPGPGNSDGQCVFPQPNDVCETEDPVWPPANGGECPPPGSNDLVFLPSEYCDTFYVCINGNPIAVQCRPGLHWNAEREFCDFPENAGCDGQNGPPLLPECPVGVTGAFPFPGDCNLFVSCNNGNRSVQRCPHLHFFDMLSARCRIFNEAICVDDVRGFRRP